MRITCRLIAALPPDRRLNRVLTRHQEQCPVCREAALRDAGVAHRLSELGGETLTAPEGMATAVMTELGTQDGSDPRQPLARRLRVRYSAWLVVGLATVAALFARLLTRRKR